jgi:hypothetical protein
MYKVGDYAIALLAMEQVGRGAMNAQGIALRARVVQVSDGGDAGHSPTSRGVKGRVFRRAQGARKGRRRAVFAAETRRRARGNWVGGRCRRALVLSSAWRLPPVEMAGLLGRVRWGD